MFGVAWFRLVCVYIARYSRRQPFKRKIKFGISINIRLSLQQYLVAVPNFQSILHIVWVWFIKKRREIRLN